MQHIGGPEELSCWNNKMLFTQGIRSPAISSGRGWHSSLHPLLVKTKLSGALQSGICSLQFARWHFQPVDQFLHSTGGLGSARYTGQGATHPGCTKSSCRQRLTIHTVLAFALGSLGLGDASTWGSHHRFSTPSQPKSASHLPQNQDYSHLRAYLGTDAPHPEASCQHAIPPGSGCNPPRDGERDQASRSKG